MILPGTIKPPKWRPGYYAKVALRHTERLVPLSDKPSRTSTAIPGPTQRYCVEVKTRQKGRAAAKMTARAGLRCLVCYAHSGGCDHTRVLGENSVSIALAVHVQGCRSSMYGALQMCDRCHCGYIIYSVQPTCSVLAQVDVVLLAPNPEQHTTKPANQVRRLISCKRHQPTCNRMESKVDHILQDEQHAQVHSPEGSTSRDWHSAMPMQPRDESGVVQPLPPGRFKLYNAGKHASPSAQPWNSGQSWRHSYMGCIRLGGNSSIRFYNVAYQHRPSDSLLTAYLPTEVTTPLRSLLPMWVSLGVAKASEVAAYPCHVFPEHSLDAGITLAGKAHAPLTVNQSRATPCAGCHLISLHCSEDVRPWMPCPESEYSRLKYAPLNPKHDWSGSVLPLAEGSSSLREHDRRGNFARRHTNSCALLMPHLGMFCNTQARGMLGVASLSSCSVLGHAWMSGATVCAPYINRSPSPWIALRIHRTLDPSASRPGWMCLTDYGRQATPKRCLSWSRELDPGADGLVGTPGRSPCDVAGQRPMAQTPNEGITKQGQGYMGSLCRTAREYAIAYETSGLGSGSAAGRLRTPPHLQPDTILHHIMNAGPLTWTTGHLPNRHFSISTPEQMPPTYSRDVKSRSTLRRQGTRPGKRQRAEAKARLAEDGSARSNTCQAGSSNDPPMLPLQRIAQRRNEDPIGTAWTAPTAVQEGKVTATVDDVRSLQPEAATCATSSTNFGSREQELMQPKQEETLAVHQPEGDQTMAETANSEAPPAPNVMRAPAATCTTSSTSFGSREQKLMQPKQEETREVHQPEGDQTMAGAANSEAPPAPDVMRAPCGSACPTEPPTGQSEVSRWENLHEEAMVSAATLHTASSCQSVPPSGEEGTADSADNTSSEELLPDTGTWQRQPPVPPLPRRLRAADHTKSGATSSNVPLVRRSSAQDTSSSPELCEEDTASSEGSGVSTDDKTGVAIRRMGELRAKLMTAMTKRTNEACSQVPFLSYCNGPWPPPPQYARMSPEPMCQVVERCHPHLSHERRSSHAGTQQQQGRKYHSTHAFVCTQACNTGSAGSHKPAMTSVLGTPDDPTCYLSLPGDWQTLPDSIAPNHSGLDASPKGACLLEERKSISLSIVVGISVLLLCGCSQLIWYSSAKCKSLRPDTIPSVTNRAELGPKSQHRESKYCHLLLAVLLLLNHISHAEAAGTGPGKPRVVIDPASMMGASRSLPNEHPTIEAKTRGEGLQRQGTAIRKIAFRRATSRANRAGIAQYRGRTMRAAQYNHLPQPPNAKTTSSHTRQMRNPPTGRNRITVMSYNAGGLSTYHYAELLAWLHIQKRHRQAPDIVMIQETHWLGEQDYSNDAWHVLATGCDRQHSGLLIMLAKATFPEAVIRKEVAIPGRVLAVRIQQDQKVLNLVNVYQKVWNGTHEAKQIRTQVLDALQKQVQQAPSRYPLIVAGDFNASLDHRSPCVGSAVISGSHAAGLPDVERLHGLLKQFDLRALNTFNPQPNKHTFTSYDARKSQIDYIFVRARSADAAAKAPQVLHETRLAQWKTGSVHHPVIANIPHRFWHSSSRTAQPRGNQARAPTGRLEPDADKNGFLTTTQPCDR